MKSKRQYTQREIEQFRNHPLFKVCMDAMVDHFSDPATLKRLFSNPLIQYAISHYDEKLAHAVQKAEAKNALKKKLLIIDGGKDREP